MFVPSCASSTYAGRHLQCSFGAGGIKEINYPATHTRVLHPISARSTQPSPFSTLYPTTKAALAITPSPGVHLFWRVPPLASHIFILYCPHLVGPFQQPGMEFFIKSLSQHRTSVYCFDERRFRLNRSDIEFYFRPDLRALLF